MLATLRRELQLHLDTRLASHHEDIFRRFAEESTQRTEETLKRYVQSSSDLGLMDDAPRGFFNPESMLQGLQHLQHEAAECAAECAEQLVSHGGRPSVAVDASALSPYAWCSAAEKFIEQATGTAEEKKEAEEDEDAMEKGSTDEGKLGSYEHDERARRRAVRLRPKPEAHPDESHPKEELFSQEKKMAHHYLTSGPVEAFISLVIATNVFFLGLEVQTTRDLPPDEIPSFFKVAEICFTAFFTLELSLRMFAHGCKDFCCGPNMYWHFMDLGFVTAALLEKAVVAIFDVRSNLHYVRLMRFIRTVRILRVLRLMVFFRPLRILVYSVMDTVKSLAWAILLLLLTVYLFAVTFTLAATQARRDKQVTAQAQADLDAHFGNLWGSMMVLFKCITGGMDWTTASESLMALSPVWAIFFLVYISFCQLAILNVITGVVCQTAIESARQDQDIVVQSNLVVKEHYVQQLQNLFSRFDEDHSGQLSLAEFEDHLSDQDMISYFEVLDLTIEEAWSLFKLLDSNATGCISTEEFVTGCLKLRGNARSIDVHMLMYQSKWTMDRLAALQKQLETMQSQCVSPFRGSVPLARPKPSHLPLGKTKSNGGSGPLNEVTAQRSTQQVAGTASAPCPDKPSGGPYKKTPALAAALGGGSSGMPTPAPWPGPAPPLVLSSPMEDSRTKATYEWGR